MIDALTKRISRIIFSVINKFNLQIIALIRDIIKRIEENNEIVSRNSDDIEKIYARLDAIDKLLEDVTTINDDDLESVAEDSAEYVGLELPQDLTSIIFTNGAVVPEGNVTLEGMPTGDSTETLAKASVNPAPKTIEIQDSIDKTL